MKLTTVTLTGADDSIGPADLRIISDQYPFVEWGILLMPGRAGQPRFPSEKWLEKLDKNCTAFIKQPLQLSAHLCGNYVEQFLHGTANSCGLFDYVGPAWDWFNRIQINTHGVPHTYDLDAMIKMLKGEKWVNKEIIFQFDNVNYLSLGYALLKRIKCSILFDLSHGAGKLPSTWPEPIAGIKCGYAGGLGADNIEKQLVNILRHKGDNEIWIDMETKLRSDDNKKFDMSKCYDVLLASKFFIFQRKEIIRERYTID